MALLGGWTDSKLTGNGIMQAERLAERLHEEISAASTKPISSDLLRAKQTAEIINEKFKLNIKYFGELRELNNGIACGMTEEDAKKVARPCAKEKMLDWQHYPAGGDLAAVLLQSI